MRTSVEVIKEILNNMEGTEEREMCEQFQVHLEACNWVVFQDEDECKQYAIDYWNLTEEV